MMKAVLFAAVVSAQTTSCLSQMATNCTTAGMNCADRPAYCYRSSATQCDTSLMTCAGAACAAGTSVTDAKTCSKCADNCRSFTTNQTCSDAGPCSWLAAGCTNGPTPAVAQPCSGITRTTCTGEVGCFWMSYTSTICGGSTTNVYCRPCNATANPLNVRSAIRNNQGKTCTWTATTPYTTAYSISITDVGQSSDVASCPAFAAAGMDDETTLKNMIKSGNDSPMGITPFGPVPFAAAATVTCKQASGVAALVPSLFLLGLIAALA